jgi:hypothetical protein
VGLKPHTNPKCKKTIATATAKANSNDQNRDNDKGDSEERTTAE